MISFVLVDLTTDVTPSEMRPAAVLLLIADALKEQTSTSFSDAFGYETPEFRVDTAQNRKPSEIAINFRDTIAVQGALAYHQVTNGVPDIEIGVDLFTDLTSTSESVSGGVSHEVLETLGDMGANGWKDKGNGIMGAEEVCDPVQNTGYQTSNGVYVSNFVLPSYFIPGAVGPWDQLGVMKSQTDLSNGYEIQTQSPTSFSQAMTKPGWGHTLNSMIKGGAKPKYDGTLSRIQRLRKSSPFSRAARRGLVIK